MSIERRGANWIVIAVALFLFLRGTIAVVRSVFFDELFTRWIVSFAPSEILEHLRSDSGPPLYYLIASVLPPATSVLSLRMLSIVLSLGALLAVLVLVKDRTTRIIAALLLATWPIHLVMSTDARSYALLASATGVATVALWRWLDEDRRILLSIATLALGVAIWTHWYGLVFVPLLIVAAAFARGWRQVVDVVIAIVVLALISIPALQLLAQQPTAAADWMADGVGGSVLQSAGSIATALSPAPVTRHPVAPPFLPTGAAIVSLALFLALVAMVTASARTSRDVRLLMTFTLVPIAGVLVLIASGRPAYFPGRFESAIAVPFVLLVAASARALTPRLRIVMTGAWVASAIAVWASWVFQMPREPQDPWRLTAMFAREAVASGESIVASGPMYLELLGQVDAEWRPRIVAFPPEQAVHPGWRARPDLDTLERTVHDLPRSAWWAGEPSGAELRVIAEQYRLEPEFSAGPVGLARISVLDE